MAAIQQHIRAGAHRPGDKLPSVRSMSEATGFSVMTVYHAYSELEAAGFIVGRPRSGFRVGAGAGNSLAAAASPRPEAEQQAEEISLESISYRVLSDWNPEQATAFGGAYPSADLFPMETLSRTFRRVLRPTRSILAQSHSGGDLQLRELIATHYVLAGHPVDARGIVITAGGMQGFNLCLTAVTRPGDTVLVEDPTFYPLLLALHERGLKAVTISRLTPSGIDPVEFDRLLGEHDVRAAILMPRCHYPTGTFYSAEVAQQIVACATRRGVPIIENDAYGELFYGRRAPPSLKKFDLTGIVLHVGSFSSSLAPGYGIGWVIPGRALARISELRFFGAMLNGELTQRAVAEYLRHEPIERHLRRLRKELSSRVTHGLALMKQFFKFDFEAMPPAGGFHVWVRGPMRLDSLELARRAMASGTNVLPGSLASTRRSHTHCFVLNLSYPWTTETTNRLRLVGSLAADLIQKS